RGARTLRAGWPLRPRYRDAGPGGDAAARPGAPGRRNAAGDYGSWVDARPPETGPRRYGKAVRGVGPAPGPLALLSPVRARAGGQYPRLWAPGESNDVGHTGWGCLSPHPRRILPGAQRRAGRRSADLAIAGPALGAAPSRPPGTPAISGARLASHTELGRPLSELPRSVGARARLRVCHPHGQAGARLGQSFRG